MVHTADRARGLRRSCSANVTADAMPTVWTVPRSTDARDRSNNLPNSSDRTDAAAVTGSSCCSCCCCGVWGRDIRVGGAERRWVASASWCKGWCGPDDADESDPSVASAVALSSSSTSSESSIAPTGSGSSSHRTFRSTDATAIGTFPPPSPTFLLLLRFCEESPPHPSGNSLSSPPGRSRTSLASNVASISARPLPNSRTLCSSSSGNAYIPAVPTHDPMMVAIHPVSGAKTDRRTSSNTTALARLYHSF
mmetsp:Transcript_10065/g.28215  ORF Transcript_10065/g.28215 Transcript_10065/m.28215 type:complete len:251 (-) Transcript_10065:317-1069(-)